MRNISEKKVVRKIKTNVSSSISFFQKSCPFWENEEKIL